MSRSTYPNAVVTEIPADAEQKVRRRVVSEILGWCQRSCKGGFYVQTIDPEQGNTAIGSHLAMYFEQKADAEMFRSVFAESDTVS